MSEPQSLCEAGRRVIDRITAEHLLLARIIAAMQAWVVAGREPGASPDHELFDAMLRYVDEVPNRVHHPQEDRLLFPAMAAIPDAPEVIAALENEHAANASLLESLRAAHEALRRQAPNALNRLSIAVDEFAEFYWAHMRREEEVLLPLAASALTPSQWDALDAAFVTVNDPVFGSELPEGYRRLHAFITSRMREPLKGYVQAAVRTS